MVSGVRTIYSFMLSSYYLTTTTRDVDSSAVQLLSVTECHILPYLQIHYPRRRGSFGSIWERPTGEVAAGARVCLEMGKAKSEGRKFVW